jgi:hypothetical protein
MLFKIPMEKLAMISIATGTASLTAIYYVRNKYRESIMKQPFVVEAIERLKSHQGAVYILGSPVCTKERCRILHGQQFCHSSYFV